MRSDVSRNTLGEPPVPSLAFFLSSLYSGGAERVVAELANILAAEGWLISVVTLADEHLDHYELRPEVRRIPLGLIRPSDGLISALRSNCRRLSEVRRTMQSLKPDVAVAFSEQSNVLLALSLIGTKTPVILSERIDPRRHDVGRIWNAARRLSYPLAASLVVQTESVAMWARRFLPERKVRVISNPVRRLPLPENGEARSNVILGVGRLDHQKGFDLLIRAFAGSVALRMSFRLVILGDGPQRSQLTALARSLNLEGRIDLPGIVAAPEKWMENAAIFVAPSRYEGFPNALVEAMAMGCPVISADCDSGPRDIVQQRINGLLVPVEDVDSLRAAMDELACDPALRRTLGANAAVVRERYALERVAGEWKRLIETVVNPQSRSDE